MDTLAGVLPFTERLQFLSLPEYAGSAISRWRFVLLFYGMIYKILRMFWLI